MTMRATVIVLLAVASQAGAEGLPCDVESVAGRPVATAQHCVKTWLSMATPEREGCTTNLAALARGSARAYAQIKKNGNAFVGAFDGLVLKQRGQPAAAAACVTTCIKLPKGSALVQLRGVVSEGGKNACPGRRTYSGTRDSEVGKPYIMQQETVETPLGPVVCVRVGNARPDEDKWGFGLFAFYREGLD